MLGTEGRVSKQDGAALPNTASHPRLHHSPPPHSRPQPGHRDTAWRAPHPATIPPSPGSSNLMTDKQTMCWPHTFSTLHHTQPAVHTHNWISCKCEETYFDNMQHCKNLYAFIWIVDQCLLPFSFGPKLFCPPAFLSVIIFEGVLPLTSPQVIELKFNVIYDLQLRSIVETENR